MLLRVPGKGRHPGTCVTATPCFPRLLSSRPATGGAFMSWSVNIGSIAGTAIRIHGTFLLFLVWIFVAGLPTGGSNDWVGSLVFMVLVVFRVVAPRFGAIFSPRSCGGARPHIAP